MIQRTQSRLGKDPLSVAMGTRDDPSPRAAQEAPRTTTDPEDPPAPRAQESATRAPRTGARAKGAEGDSVMLNARVPPALIDEGKRVAGLCGVSLSDLVRDGLRAEIARRKRSLRAAVERELDDLGA